MEEPADTAVLDTEMKNNINDQDNSKNDAETVQNNCKISKANPETKITSWPMFITCSSLLAQHFHPVILVTLSNPFRPPLFRTL